jgi:hypothetical protein
MPSRQITFRLKTPQLSLVISIVSGACRARTPEDPLVSNHTHAAGIFRVHFHGAGTMAQETS